MSNLAVEVTSLSKIYRVGVRENRRETFVGSVLDAIRSPVSNYRRLRALTKFERTEYEADDVIWALRDVSFNVRRGEVLGIIGANGAGKSTLLKILAGITEPTAGRTLIRGRLGSLLEVGTGMHPELTGRENIFLTGTLLGMKKIEIESKLDEIVGFAEMEKFIDTPVKRYSSGMKVRLGFAIAGHLEPEILLIDEVLAVGDARFQRKCLGKMGEISGEGRTVLFVSHNMSAVQSLCARAILIEHGTVALDASVEEAIFTYLDLNLDESAGDKVDLGERTNRQGNGPFRFENWWIEDDALGRGRRARVGQACRFRIEYNGGSTKLLSNVKLTLTIKDGLGRPVVTAATRFQNAELEVIPGFGGLSCEFQELPIGPGPYHLYLSCVLGDELSDRIDDAGTFEVIPFDVFGTGRLPAPHHGPLVCTKFKWSVG